MCVRYAGNPAYPAPSTEEGSVSLNPDYVGRTLRCGECSHQFVITPNTIVTKTLRDKNGKVIGFTTRCEKCGEAVFIGASMARRLPA